MATASKTKKQTNPPIHPDPRLIHAYTDKAGNHYWQFMNDATMTYKRYMSAKVEEHFIRMGCTSNYLKGIVKVLNELALDSSRKLDQLRTDIMKVSGNLDGHIDYVLSEQHYLRLASVYYLVDNEPVEEVSEYFTQIKMKNWTEDSKAKDFFLQKAFTNTMSLADMSLTAIKNFLDLAIGRMNNLPPLPKASNG